MTTLEKTREKNLWEKFLTFFGDIKIYPHPLFIVYDPGSYRIKGPDLREILEILQPGDILLRGYDNYLDGKFIGGTFSHAGFYFGEATEADRPAARAGTQENGKDWFTPGKQMVVHSMAEGVFMEDILTFTRCDKIAVLRLPGRISKNTEHKLHVVSSEMPDFSPAEERIYQALKNGKTVASAEAVVQAKRLALAHLGYAYDFGFDFETHKSFSCTEFVYFIYRCVCPFVDIKLVEQRLLFLTKKVLRPDDFLQTGLEQVWLKK
ncbi:YiiX/YebB-like N1pC/P60 family cysteine hydrolase [Methylomonas sp. SURF-1]|uniref:YiiX/YebB-like N1pC/P60 family cysteine hydrolase n=1 Tax=Methylomonas aurea TaxID=2952224 RepID=A0ABT1ULK2_9GAMM|nr:YiiX/YebB-like N1pC/P60 family cysteine hydrolase [Methylomonas sp. SURF-1]MCQ8182584.1 YiiX/YebB-like N1pC/P60 family cysteine hydrolase [Methylomonas sp. SURF-1]